MRVRRRRMVIGSVVALAIIGGGGAAALEVRDNIQAQQQCADAKSRHGGSFKPVQYGGGRQQAAIVGDSYTEGHLLDQPTNGWAFLLAKTQGWDASIDGIGSTGFVNESACGGDSFKTRMAGANHAKVVVIQGGVNDFRKDTAAIEAAADQTLKLTGRVERVVMVGPAPAPARDNLQAVDASLAAVAKLNQREYISALSWSDLEFLPDGVHLTERGHAQFAARVADALRTSR